MVVFVAQTPIRSVRIEDLLPELSTIVVFGAAILILGAIGYYVVSKIKRQVSEEEGADVSHSLFVEIRNAYQAGEISGEEYKKIRSRLTAGIRNAVLSEDVEDIRMDELPPETEPDTLPVVTEKLVVEVKK